MKAYSVEKKIVSDYLKYYSSFEVDKMVDLFSEDCIFENITNSMETIECKGKQELHDYTSTASMIFKQRKKTAINWVIEKNKIAVEVDFIGTLAIGLKDGHQAGDVIKMRGASIFEFENNKIKRLVDFF